MSTVCNACVLVMHAWVVGPNKRFTQYIVRIPAETPDAYVVNFLHVPAKTHRSRYSKKIDCGHNFAGLVALQKYDVK